MMYYSRYRLPEVGSAGRICMIQLLCNFYMFVEFPFYYWMKYVRTASTAGAQHIGHFPRDRTRFSAQFVQVHMCPHLYELIH